MYLTQGLNEDDKPMDAMKKTLSGMPTGKLMYSLPSTVYQ